MGIPCSCGQHDLPQVPLDDCHFCGALTACHPVIDWDLGRLYYAICHACMIAHADGVGLPSEALHVPVHLAPPELVARAHAFDVPNQGLGEA